MSNFKDASKEERANNERRYHVMKLEERTDLLCNSSAIDPFATDNCEDYWAGFKQELPDDLEISKVTLTNLPTINVDGENQSKHNNSPVTEQILETVDDLNSNNAPVDISYQRGISDSSEGDYSDTQCSSSEESSEEHQDVKKLSPGVQNKKKPQSCDICNKTLSSKSTLRQHKLKKHNEKVHFTCEICGEKFDFQREVVKHRNSSHREEDGRFSCETCKKRFSDFHNFLMHRKTHVNEERLTCAVCMKSFADQEGLDEHLSKDHSASEKETVRGKCKKLARNHTCDTCGKSFVFNCLLQDHLNLHTGAKPYLCQECGKAFSHKSTLKQHEKTHSDIRPFQCSQCPSGFYCRGDLTKHLRKHTGERPYVCEVCGERFSRSTHLAVHRRTHTGERPYSCHICGRGFIKRGDVNRHQRIHNGEFPYLCQVCGKSFRQSSQCANHIKSHHPDSPLQVVKNPNPYNNYSAQPHLIY